jgi:hypothetical protein
VYVSRYARLKACCAVRRNTLSTRSSRESLGMEVTHQWFGRHE